MMVIAVGCLLIIGVLFVYSACYVSDGQEERTLYLRQMVWVFVGIGCYFFFTIFDYRKWKKLSPWFYGFSICLLFQYVSQVIPLFYTKTDLYTMSQK